MSSDGVCGVHFFLLNLEFPNNYIILKKKKIILNNPHIK